MIIQFGPSKQEEAQRFFFKDQKDEKGTIGELSKRHEELFFRSLSLVSIAQAWQWDDLMRSAFIILRSFGERRRFYLFVLMSEDEHTKSF